MLDIKNMASVWLKIITTKLVGFSTKPVIISLTLISQATNVRGFNDSWRSQSTNEMTSSPQCWIPSSPESAVAGAVFFPQTFLCAHDADKTSMRIELGRSALKVASTGKSETKRKIASPGPPLFSLSADEILPVNPRLGRIGNHLVDQPRVVIIFRASLPTPVQNHHVPAPNHHHQAWYPRST